MSVDFGVMGLLLMAVAACVIELGRQAERAGRKEGVWVTGARFLVLAAGVWLSLGLLGVVH